MTNTRLRSILGLAAVLALAGWASHASASAFQLVEQNGSGLGNAYVGQAAAAEDASTIFWNPAGMALLPGGQVSAGIVLVRPTTKFVDEGSQPGRLSPTVVLPGTRQGGNGGDAGSINYVPNGYVSYEVVKNFVWGGVGVSTPFGLKTEWDDGWVGRFHALKSDVKTVNINPSVALKLGELFSVGAGFDVQWIQAELSNAVNYSGIVAGAAGAPALALLATCPGATAGVNCEGVATVKGDAWSYGWNVGVMLNLPTRTRVGASYRSSIEHDIEGTVKFTNRPALVGPLAPLEPRLADGDVKTKIKLPDTAILAVSQKVGDKLELLADFSFTHWKTLQDLSIFRANGATLTQTPLNFKNSWKAGVGANYQLLPAVKVRGGVSYDESPVRDEFRTPRLPDQDRLWVATGLQLAPVKAFAVDAGFAWLFVKEGRSNLGQPPPFNGNAQAPRGTLVGHYTETAVWILGGQARYSF